MPQVDVERHLGGNHDVLAARALLEAAGPDGGHRLLPDDPAFALLAREHGRADPVGYAHLGRGQGGWSLEVVVDKSSQSRRPAWESLTAASLDLVGREGGGPLRMWVHEATSEHDELAVAAGLTPDRDLYRMDRPLPTDEPATLLTRPFVVGQDEPAWLGVNNRAFAGHPEQGGWASDRLSALETEPWFDPAGLLLHERDGRLAGFCWTKVHADAKPPLGELFVVAVDPDFQGLGLGRRLVVAGLDWLWRRGLEWAILYVEASNRAVRLYESLGFSLHHVDRAYAGVVPPINEPST